MMPKPEHIPFYNSKGWKRIRKVALIRDGGMCVWCRDDGLHVKAFHVDHVVPLEKDRSKGLLLSNLQSLCVSCHSRKTAIDIHNPVKMCVHGFPYGVCCS